MEKITSHGTKLDCVNPTRLDRADDVGDLVVFAYNNQAWRVDAMRRFLNSEEICCPSGFKWISFQSQYNFNSAQANKGYRAAVVTYGVLVLGLQLSRINKVVGAC